MKLHNYIWYLFHSGTFCTAYNLFLDRKKLCESQSGIVDKEDITLDSMSDTNDGQISYRPNLRLEILNKKLCENNYSGNNVIDIYGNKDKSIDFNYFKEDIDKLMTPHSTLNYLREPDFDREDLTTNGFEKWNGVKNDPFSYEKQFESSSELEQMMMGTAEKERDDIILNFLETNSTSFRDQQRNTEDNLLPSDGMLKFEYLYNH